MEMYTSKDKNVLTTAFQGHAVNKFFRIAHSILKIGLSSGERAKTEAERQAENRKRCYEAQAIADTWQGPRYYR